VPVVLSSGYSEEDTMARSAGLPGVSFIQKPYTPAQIVAKVGAALRSRQKLQVTPLGTEN
jgi:DNA-binding response OmpR family regulator